MWEGNFSVCVTHPVFGNGFCPAVEKKFTHIYISIYDVIYIVQRLL